MTEKFKLLDLFSGIGGFSLGLERSGGFETVAFCEIDPFCRKVLAKHWPKVPCYDDIRTLTANRLAADGIAPNAISGGFPCQDISHAGRQRGLGEGTRSGLYSEVIRITDELRPIIVLLENVTALFSGPSERPGWWLGRILGDLAEIGYDAEWHCIPASSVGAPHSRDRVWILAYPEQEQRVCPVLNADNAAEAIRTSAAEWQQNGVRPEVGTESRSVPSRWMDQPDPKRVVDGVSDWPHRLGSLGNAVVPQIPELIGRAILHSLRE